MKEKKTNCSPVRMTLESTLQRLVKEVIFVNYFCNTYKFLFFHAFHKNDEQLMSLIPAVVEGFLDCN